MFERGARYRRSELHELWGGARPVQRQGGILTPREAPLVLIVSGERGERYGYDDHWDDEGVFHYYGAGQSGDMEFVRGNRAIRDHQTNGRALHLLLEDGDQLAYWGELVYAGFDEVDGALDQHGEPRRAIVFRLVPSDDGAAPAPAPERSEPAAERRWTMALDELAEQVEATGPPPTDAREARRRIYRRSEALKVLVRRRAAGRCEGCGREAPFLDRQGRPYLEPHHTTRVADGGPDVPEHVIALCPDCHRRVHSGQDGATFNDSLRAKLAAIVAGPLF